MDDSIENQPDGRPRSNSVSSTDSGYPSAPVYDVPSRKIVAIEHPCIVMDLDNGLKSFGSRPNLRKLVDDTRDPQALPLWFRPNNPTSKPIVSHHAATNNILLKITVPKRTGRKRKRDTGGPFLGDTEISDSDAAVKHVVGSTARQDHPQTILRKLQDNSDRYHVEAVGMIRDSHRYRGLADFQFAPKPDSFIKQVGDHLLPLQLSKLREFKIDEGVKTGQGIELIPPPHFTDKVIGFNYNYEQNPGITERGVDEDGEPRLVNRQGRKVLSYGYFIHHDSFPVPVQPRDRRDGNALDRVPDSLMKQLHRLMEQRPIWTRRSIINNVEGVYAESLLKLALQLVGYQFRGGPFRDAIVKYGIDPRTDPKYRKYQTVAFKMSKNMMGETKLPWQTIRRGQINSLTNTSDRNSHLWDGKNFSVQGKLWQLCDIIDPFVVDLLKTAQVRPECDVAYAGWFYPGLWLKVKTVMKAKMIAIMKGRLGSEDDDPQKEGYVYNSLLRTRLALYPDETGKPGGITLEALLRPLSELNSNPHKNNRRPQAPTARGRGRGRVHWNTPRDYSHTSDDIDDDDDEDEDEDIAFVPGVDVGNNNEPASAEPPTNWENMVDSDVEDDDEEEVEGSDEDDEMRIEM
ncbi:hypothetical protein GGR57DRAFT_202840 [Xylariaceae sp. FL1272]|nr:hypothetical protein GGR57DRAFT_202840 [Xylariaceae sp. FL1272]